MALLKYAGNIDLSRNKILNILGIQGPNYYSDLSSNLEVTTKDETTNASGSLILRSGTGKTPGNVYLFAGRNLDAPVPSDIVGDTQIYGITLFPGTNGKNDIIIKSAITRILSDTKVRLERGDTVITLVEKEKHDDLEISSQTINILDTVSTSISSEHLVISVSKSGGGKLKIDTNAEDYIVTTPTLSVTDHANVTNYVDIGDIRIKYDSSSSCLIFGSKV